MPTESVDSAALQGAKALLRKAVVLRRQSRSEEQRRADDEARFALIQQTLLDRGPLDRLACYVSTTTEPGTLQLIGWLASQDVEILLPVLTDGSESLLPEPAWARYTGPDELRTGRRSILEPTGPLLDADEVRKAEIIICPAVAADPSGQRLGRGGGWYDRVLERVPDAEAWTLINDDELMEEVPAQSWDRPVARIVTQARVIDCPPNVP